MTYDEALEDLKLKVGDLMGRARELAMLKIDRLRATGIVDDHIRVSEDVGEWLIPRDFIAAFSEEMRDEFGWVTSLPRDGERNKRIQNYRIMM